MIQMQDEQNTQWQRQAYVIGIVAGAALGLVTAMLYTRAAQEDAERNHGKPTPIPTGQLIGLLLTVLGLIRQITEAGKAPKK